VSSNNPKARREKYDRGLCSRIHFGTCYHTSIYWSNILVREIQYYTIQKEREKAMSKPISSFYDATKYLGQFVGEEIPFLRETSCMSGDMREYIAYLDMFVTHFCDDPKFKKFLQEKIRPSLKHFGFALWKRDTVTDMALRKGSGTEEETFEDSSKDEPDST
jgi:hypothetical protein